MDKEPGPLIIQQCNVLEQVYNTSYSSALLEGSDSLKQIKKYLLKAAKHLHGALCLSTGVLTQALVDWLKAFQGQLALPIECSCGPGTTPTQLPGTADSEKPDTIM